MSTPFVSNGIYFGGEGTNRGGHHKALNNPISEHVFFVEFDVKSRNVFGTGANWVSLLVDDQPIPNPYGGATANGFGIMAFSYCSCVTVVKYSEGSGLLLTQWPFPTDEQWHRVKIEHLVDGSWRCWVDGIEQPDTVSNSDPSPYTNFQFISLSMDVNDGPSINALDNIAVWNGNPDSDGDGVPDTEDK